MINLCLALLLLYIQSSCNKFISASGSVEGCIVIAVLGHWFILSMLISLAAYSLWIYLKIVRLFSEEPQYYKHKAFAATWREYTTLHIHICITVLFVQLFHRL